MSNKIYGQAWFIDRDPEIVTVNGKELYKPVTSLVQDITVFDGYSTYNQTVELVHNIWDQLSTKADSEGYDDYPGNYQNPGVFDDYHPKYKTNNKGFFYWEVPMSDLYSPENIEKVLVECPKPFDHANFVNDGDKGFSNFFFVFNEEREYGIYTEDDENYDPLHPYQPYEKLEPFYTPVPDPEHTIPVQDPIPEHWVIDPEFDTNFSADDYGTYANYWLRKFIEASLNFENTIVIQKKEVIFPAFDYDDQEGNKVGSNPKVIFNNDLGDIENLLSLF